MPRKRQVVRLPHSTQVRQIIKANPGRLSGATPAEPKPGPDDTPYRSAFYVNNRHSADGHSYRKGEPVSDAEAQRQGLVGRTGEPRHVRLGVATIRCPKCKGSGRRARFRSHKPDCPCVACKPCSQCSGSGQVAAAQG